MSATTTWERNVETYPQIEPCKRLHASGAWEFSPMAADILAKADRYCLTPRQTQVLEACVRGHERQAERRRLAAELRAAGVECPTGRREISGQVVSIKWHTSRYGRRESTVQKMVVKTDAGWAVWATVPPGLPAADVEVGIEIQFEATIQKSDRDPLFGFAKRPTKARILRQPTDSEKILTPA
jgi:hypothetical protein